MTRSILPPPFDEDQCAFIQKCNQKAMQRLSKAIGVLSIVALTLAAVAETAAALEDKDIISDQTVCKRGLNTERSGWVNGSFYSEEAVRRGLTVEVCRKLVAQQPSAPTVAPPAASTTPRGDFAMLSYETGLSESFLAKFEDAAGRLNVGPSEARRTILTLTGNLRDLPRYGTIYRELQNLGDIELDAKGQSHFGPEESRHLGERLVNQLQYLVKQQDIERAAMLVISTMREENLIHRRYVAATFQIPVRLALLFDGATRSEIEMVSYETGLPTQFLDDFQRAAQNLGVSPTESSRLIKTLTWKLTEISWLGQSRKDLQMIGASWLANDLGILIKFGDVAGAAEKLLQTMKKWNPEARRYSAQAFGIPESTVLIYDELQRLRKGTTGSSN